MKSHEVWGVSLWAAAVIIFGMVSLLTPAWFNCVMLPVACWVGYRCGRIYDGESDE